MCQSMTMHKGYLSKTDTTNLTLRVRWQVLLKLSMSMHYWSVRDKTKKKNGLFWEWPQCHIFSSTPNTSYLPKQSTIPASGGSTMRLLFCLRPSLAPGKTICHRKWGWTLNQPWNKTMTWETGGNALKLFVFLKQWTRHHEGPAVSNS